MAKQIKTESRQPQRERRESYRTASQSFDGQFNPMLQLHGVLGNHRLGQLIQAKRVAPEGKQPEAGDLRAADVGAAAQPASDGNPPGPVAGLSPSSAPEAVQRDRRRQEGGVGDTPSGGPDAPFVPVVSSGGMEFALLGGMIDAPARVTNAREAPRGTTFRWGWKDGSVNAEKLEVRPTTPASGSRATLHARVKRVFESERPVPTVEIDVPGRPLTRVDGAPLDVGVVPPDVQFLVVGPTAGAGGARAERSTSRLFVGDSIELVADVNQAEDARGTGTQMLTMSGAVGSGSLDLGTTTWDDNHTAARTLTAKRPGMVTLSASMLLPGVEEPAGEYVEAIEIVADPGQFIDQCGLANTRLNESYSKSEAFIRTATDRYKEGYDAHKAALDRQSARDQLTQQLILGVIFSAVGGAAGGAVGGLLKGFADKGLGQAALTGVVTELATNVASLAAPVIQGPPGASGGGAAGGGARIGTGAIAAGGATGGGATGAAAIEPFTWHNAALGTLARERSEAFRLLGRMQEAAINARNTRADFQASFDPHWLVTDQLHVAGQNLWEIDETAIPAAIDYERSFWEAWLSQYAYRLSTGEVHSAEENVGKDLREEIDRVASRFGESADQWIARYGAPAREREERRAHEYNTSGPFGTLPQRGPKW